MRLVTVNGLRIEEFTIDGKESGTVTLPCDSQTVRVVVAL
jgi:hypothetical protein